MRKTCPVWVISGFLGAGKTSLIRRMLPLLKAGRVPGIQVTKEHPLLIVENDFGDLSFDANMLRKEQVTVRELSQGCICCSLALDFRAALRELSREYEPSLLIIEPSGIGLLSELLKYLLEEEVQERFSPFFALTVLDARFFDKYLMNFGHFFADQIRFAHRLLLNRTAALSAGEIERLCGRLDELADTVDFLFADLEDAEDAELIAAFAAPAAEEELPETGTPRAAPAFRTLSARLSGLSSEEALNLFFASIEEKCRGRLLRAKGLVLLGEAGRVSVQWVPGEVKTKRSDDGDTPPAVSFIFSGMSASHFRFLLQQSLHGVREGRK